MGEEESPDAVKSYDLRKGYIYLFTQFFVAEKLGYTLTES